MKEFYKSFRPMLTPKEMLRKGIFGGTYFNKLVDYRIFPEDWFYDLDESYYLSSKYMLPIGGMLTALFVFLKWGVDDFIRELVTGMENKNIDPFIVKVFFIISALVVGFIISNEIIAIITGNPIIG